ncbi:DinB family protein [Croceivirga thetidis]|uniref:DinB-like domain-containing protein n=1 Tax=Croceivirga thetidis TaxID=2721623 RepID=A0ABX1GN64_9FLAO|nr:DinB family protein [Croceivirga thetidis]NKI31348.1 hypothetical protein [Croceivirga thetidis]
MAKLLLTPENQIQRLNQLLNFVDDLKTIGVERLKNRPNEKSWNTIEVLEHLNIAYSLYADNIHSTLEKLKDDNNGPWEYKPGFWNRFVIEGQRPKGSKRPFKMKTLKKFEPLLPNSLNEATIEEVFNRFKNAHNQLKSFIVESRTKRIEHKKITSAIGPIVKFHLPEAFEFLICHAERHKIQIDEILGS